MFSTIRHTLTLTAVLGATLGVQLDIYPAESEARRLARATIMSDTITAAPALNCAIPVIIAVPTLLTSPMKNPTLTMMNPRPTRRKTIATTRTYTTTISKRFYGRLILSDAFFAFRLPEL
jgi:hypothetical protein